ncbi:esterase/lipase family protein [Roseimaritima sediminicola]|uniref:esterase/lipase family protein n=1 Tax=Roseimaritima sediminicola TaxID=2662066 RepID=UPI001F29CF38|nr:alpha/beta hydrolase family protein [Roseimaritima sediminicola]
MLGVDYNALPLLGGFLIWITGSSLAAAQPPGPQNVTNAAEEGFSMPIPNVPLPTLGGTQVWTDHRNVAGWRLQQHALTGHWRLLDDRDIRRAWGDREACENKLREATADIDQHAAADHVVILLHGLMRSKHSMRGLGRRIGQCADAPEVIAFSYASTRAGIPDHAAALRELVEGLPGEPRISFVGHSMGNIVVRHAIADWQAAGDPKGVLPRLDCMVMLGPPNQGAAIARKLSKLGLFGVVTGEGGMQLGPHWQRLCDGLATPPCPFAIIAGDMPGLEPYNPLVDGSSDLVVSVEEARLDGAAEFHTVPHLHSFLMDQHDVQDLTLRFLGLGELGPGEDQTREQATE